MKPLLLSLRIWQYNQKEKERAPSNAIFLFARKYDLSPPLCSPFFALWRIYSTLIYLSWLIHYKFLYAEIFPNAHMGKHQMVPPLIPFLFFLFFPFFLFLFFFLSLFLFLTLFPFLWLFKVEK